MNLKKHLWEAIVFLFTMAVFFPTIFAEFLWDDQRFVIENLYLTSWRYLPEIFSQSITEGSGLTSNLFRPLQSVTHLIDVTLWGYNPLGHHFTNVFLTASAAVLLFKIFKQYFSTAIAALVILMYVCHPMFSTIVAYVSGRGDLLVLLFLAASVLSFPTRAWLTALFVALGIASKESGLLIPAFLILYNLVEIRRANNPTFFWRQHLIYCAMAIAYLILRFTVLNFQNSANFYNSENIFTQNFIYRLFTYFSVMAKGLSLWFWPHDLHHERSWLVYTEFWQPLVLVGFSIILGFLVWAAWGWNRKNAIITLGALWFIGATIPTSNLFIMINALIYDHWFIIPGLGLFFILGTWLNKWSPRLAVTACLLLLAAEIPATQIENKVWKNPISLNENILKYEPRSAKVMNNLAMELQIIDPDRAEKLFLQAISIDDSYAETHHNLGMLYLNKKNYTKALQEYDLALKKNPQLYQSWTYKGLTYMYQQNSAQAVAALEKSLSLHPSSMAFKLLFEVYKATGQMEKAQGILKQAQKLGFPI